MITNTNSSGMAHPWKDLIVWQKAHELVLAIYKLTNNFREMGRFGLTQLIRKSSISVAANIVEGKSKNTDKEFSAYLYNSRGSLEETRYHIILSKDLKYIDAVQYDNSEKLATEVSFLLNKLIASLNK